MWADAGSEEESTRAGVGGGRVGVERECGRAELGAQSHLPCCVFMYSSKLLTYVATTSTLPSFLTAPSSPPPPPLPLPFPLSQMLFPIPSSSFSSSRLLFLLFLSGSLGFLPFLHPLPSSSSCKELSKREGREERREGRVCSILCVRDGWN